MGSETFGKERNKVPGAAEEFTHRGGEATTDEEEDAALNLTEEGEPKESEVGETIEDEEADDVTEGGTEGAAEEDDARVDK